MDSDSSVGHGGDLESPDDMFKTIQSGGARIGARLGRVNLAGRNAIETPHYIGITSRGVVPHITQDTFEGSTSIAGVNVNLEDCTSRIECLQH